MSGTLGFVAIGLLLIGLLGALLRRSKSAADHSFALPQTYSSFPSLKFEERRKDILDRVFGHEDWDFILNHGSKEIRRLFLLERKKIALSWLSEIRSQSKAAMSFHFSHAGKSERLQPMQELRLAADFFAITAKSAFIAVIILLRGPVALRGMVGRAYRLSGQFHGWLEEALQADAFARKAKVWE